eukprot:SAG31_NODE_2724_length_5187_cov_2.096895_1_plen_63_part_00
MVLTASDLSHFTEHGWVIARGVIDKGQAALTAREVWDFAGLDPCDEDSCRYAKEDGVATPRR